MRHLDVELSYLELGNLAHDDAAIVVLLHGLAGSAQEFLPTAERLAPAFGSILLDQRGHGRSTRAPADTSREAYVSDVVAIIERAAGGRPVHLVGQSMGAHTAMLTAAARPDLVDRLVMLEAAAGAGPADEAAAIGSYFASWPVPFADEKTAQAFLGDGALARAWTADLEERKDGLWPRFEPQVMESTIAAVHEPRWAEWSSVAAPTLLVYAEKDSFSPEQKDEMIARRRGTFRVDLPDTFHDAHLDSFGAWMSALNGFLWTCQSASKPSSS